MIEALVELAAELNKNEIVKYCMSKHDDYGKAGQCITQLDAAQRHIEEERLWQYMQEHPQYRYSGMALPNNAVRPLDECWGKTRLYHEEGGCKKDELR